MPILIQCTHCQRKLRLQDHLLGKTVKCPNCQKKFVAQQVQDSAPKTAAPSIDEGQPTPVVPPAVSLPASEPMPALAALQVAEINEPASAPSAPKQPAAMVPQVPPKPRRFEPSYAVVIAVVAAALLVTAGVGFGLGSWIAAAVERTSQQMEQEP